MKLSPPEYVLSVKPYVPGKPMEELERDYGITDSIKLASNENPLGPSPMALDAIRDALGGLNRYPDGSCYSLVRKLSDRLGISSDTIVLGNGSDDIIGMLTRALLRPGDEAVMAQPSFAMYDIMTRLSGAKPVYVPLARMSVDLDAMAAAVTSRTRLVFLTNPNNPTGSIFSEDAFISFLGSISSDIVVVVDEAYIEFVRDPACAHAITFAAGERPVVVLRTFSKAFGLAGIRIGYGVMPAELALLLNRVRQPFNVNSLAQAAAMAAMDDDGFLNRTLEVVHNGLEYLYEELDRMGIAYVPTQANFLLVAVRRDADEVFEEFLRRGVIVRSMSSYGYPSHIRVTVGLPEENARFISVLKDIMQ